MSKKEKQLSPEDQVKELEAKLAEANEKLAEHEKKEKEAPKPSGTKMIIPVKDLKNADDFPEEGSDGKGNLIKFVANDKAVKELEKAGWKVAK